ncbi:MAG: sigma-70 family RNA polymerase sigma factor [Xanthobacteraceae bacterium]|nr:sigma-70 family RNA polymerase sigma factor [Xanthobacteraceae bacterium]
MDTLRQVHKTFLQFLRRRLRNHGEAEEVMQQFYLRVVAHASQLRKEESAVVWLRRVLQSALSDHWRRNAVRMRAEADFGRKDAAAPSLTEEIDDVVCKCLARILPLLKPEYADVLRRVELEGETRESVAADLGLTPGNLTVRLHRARQALHRALTQTCETCPVHGYFDCGCEYTKRLRSGRRRAPVRVRTGKGVIRTKARTS